MAKPPRTTATRPMPVALRHLAVETAIEFAVPLEQLLPGDGRRYQARIVRARHCALYLATLTGRHSLAQLGRMFGLHHTSVIHARDRGQMALAEDPEFRAMAEAIARRMNPTRTPQVTA